MIIDYKRLELSFEVEQIADRLADFYPISSSRIDRQSSFLGHVENPHRVHASFSNMMTFAVKMPWVPKKWTSPSCGNHRAFGSH